MDPQCTDPSVCRKCGRPLAACECCIVCGQPECDCREELNGDNSDPFPEGSLTGMLEDLEHEEQP